MEIYQNKPRIKLSPTVRHGRKFIEVSFDHDGLRLPLSKEEGVQLVGGRAYLPEESFVLAEFFDRYVKMAFIDYSAIKGYTPRKEEDSRLPGFSGAFQGAGGKVHYLRRHKRLPAVSHP